MAPLEEQMFSFLVSISAGCLAAFCFDVYKTFTNFFRIRRVALGVGDILFWIILTGIVFVLLLFSNGGEIRGFMLVGLAAGVGIYLRVLGEHSSRVIAKIFEAAREIVRFTGKVILWLWIVVTTPVKLTCFVVTWPFKILYLLINKVVNLVTGMLYRFVPMRLRNMCKKVVLSIRNLKARIKRKKK